MLAGVHDVHYSLRSSSWPGPGSLVGWSCAGDYWRHTESRNSAHSCTMLPISDETLTFYSLYLDAWLWQRVKNVLYFSTDDFK